MVHAILPRRMECPGTTTRPARREPGRPRGDFGCASPLQSTDEAGHMGDPNLKVKAIEDFDQLLIGTLLEGLKRIGPFRLMLLPDHTTSTAIRTHTHDPVPFVLFGEGVRGNNLSVYNEQEATKSQVWISEGYTLMGKFLKGEF